MADPTVLLVHGPNLSQLGARDPEHYGSLTLDEVVDLARHAAEAEGASLQHAVSEHEGALVERLHAARTDGTGAVVINAGALTHYSYALRDALELLPVPKVEVHLSNVHAREGFRRVSVLADVCDATISGLGAQGVALAVTAAIGLARRRG